MKTVCFRIGVGLGLAAVVAGSNACYGQNWAQTSAPFTNWSSVASSADGSFLAACVNRGLIYVSTNSGLTWVQTPAPTNAWTSLACSADGTKLFAASFLLGNLPVYYSGDSGAAWQSIGENGVDFVVCSADGSRVAAAGGGAVVVSTNSGATWTLLGPGAAPPEARMTVVASCADGGTLAIVNTFLGGPPSSLGTTPSSGWMVDYLTPPPYVLYTAVAVSGNGTRLAATINNYGYMVEPPTTNCGGTMGMLYASLTSGTNGIITCTPVTNWTSIASSADGNRLVAVAGDGAIYTSRDAGTNWLPASVTNANWSGVASSADGCKLVAVANGGGIYTWQTTPDPALNIGTTNGALLISWVIPSTRFVLQQNSSLTSTNWADLTAPVALNLTNLQEQVSIPAPTTPTFYRLKGL